MLLATVESYFYLLVAIALFVVAIQIFFFLISPVMVKFNHRSRAVPQIEPYDREAAAMPEEVARCFGDYEPGLEKTGFHHQGYFTSVGDVNYVVSIVSLWKNQADSTAALYMVIFAPETESDAEGFSQHQRMVVNQVALAFETAFNEGGSLETTQVPPELSCFAQIPQKKVFQFPFVKDGIRLYKIHKALLAREERFSVKPLPEGSGEEIIIRHMKKEHEQQVEAGYLKLDRTGDYYIPTWKGAFLMTWKLMPPGKNIRNWLGTRRMQQVLQGLRRSGAID